MNEESSSSTLGWILLPVIIVALASIITVTVLIMKGQCCACCYKKFKGLQKYQKQPGSPDKLSAQNSLPQSSEKKTVEANYESMNKNKNGKKNEFEANGTPSILNFDITGDVTRDITDIEANVTAAHTPHKRPATVNKPMHQARNSTASNFMDPMTQASNREKVIFT